MKRVLRAVSATLWAALCLSLVGCATDSGGATPSNPLKPTPGSARTGLPDASVLDVGSGESVTLRALFPNPKPLLVWFWAPH